MIDYETFKIQITSQNVSNRYDLKANTKEATEANDLLTNHHTTTKNADCQSLKNSFYSASCVLECPTPPFKATYIKGLPAPLVTLPPLITYVGI